MKPLTTRDNSRILIVGDIHAPAQHPDMIDFLQFVCDSYDIKPSRHRIILSGDEIDSHAMGRWPSDPDLDSAGRELEQAIEELQPLFKLFPVVDVCESNHTWRSYRQAYLAGIPKRCLREIGDWLDAPEGWTWRDRVVITDQPTGPIQFIHGDGFSGKYGGRRAAETHRMNTVIGHIHSNAGISYMQGNNGNIFGFNVGCLIWPFHPAFDYAKWTANRPSLGVGVIVDGRPLWEPMLIDPKTWRWIGE